MRSKHGDGDLRIADDGDGYMILQCRCGCKPMDIAAALPKLGIWPFDPHVVEWEGAPALRTRATVEARRDRTRTRGAHR
jgi:hypothetical protein